MSIADEIGKLNELRQSGAITEEEYHKAKEVIFTTIIPIKNTLNLSFFFSII
jgi:hypothetical protein